MNKIYMVIADNGQSYEDHDRWNVRAFTSKEAAQAYIVTLTEEIKAAGKRLYELGVKKYDEGLELTEDEEKEYERVNELDCDYWHFFDHGGFLVVEYELYD